MSKTCPKKGLKPHSMKKVILIILCLALCLGFGSCTQANKVSSNISKEADNFNVVRKLSVVNARSDVVIFELIGRFSFELSNNRIICICQTDINEFKKHSIGLNEWTLWFVEDISGADVNSYRYEINWLPTMIGIDITESH